MKTPLIALALASFVVPATAQAVTIDFEAQVTPSTPNFISPDTAAQTLSIGGVTFTGGQLINATDDFFDPDQGDLSGTYMTFDYLTTLHTLNPITFTFTLPANSVSFEIVNNIAGNYLVTTNLGSQTFSLGDYANQTISLTSPGITTVSVKYTTTNSSPPFDFAIDNVSFAPVPEPATWAMMVGGFGVAGGALRRRRAIARLHAA